MRKKHFNALEALADGKPHKATSDNPLKEVWPDLVGLGLATRVECEDKNKPWCYGVGYIYTITEEGQRIAGVKQMELF